jgi:hypothetical protein
MTLESDSYDVISTDIAKGQSANTLFCPVFGMLHGFGVFKKT